MSLQNLAEMENMQRRRKLLLVDDDSDDRKYFKEALTEIDASIELIEARDGQQAMTVLNNQDFSLPDYIFLDLRMPKVNGRQCLIQIKESEKLKHIPVIVYTTSKEVEDSDALQALGAVRFITKPANTDEIYYVISQVLEEEQNDLNR